MSFLPTFPPSPTSLSHSRSTRTLSLWPPSGPSPPSTPLATPFIRTERPRSSLPPCHAPSRPCPGSSAPSTINETSTPTHPLHFASAAPPSSSPPISDPASRTEDSRGAPPPPPHPSFWNVMFGIRDGHYWELVKIDYQVVRLKMCCLDPHVWSMPCTGYKLKCPLICPLTENLSSPPL